jgi:hypothetical protein
MFRKAHHFLKHFGFNGRQFLDALSPRRQSWVDLDLAELQRQRNGDRTFPLGKAMPILTDREDQGGVMSGHYFHQDLYVARKIHEANPVRHLDIGSRIDGFVAHVASFRSIEIIDIRPVSSTVKNIHFRQADLMQLPRDLIDSAESLSSLHVIEHFGLGRYGDPIDYWGFLKAINNIALILRAGGLFYFSVPIGSQRIEFNAHRVFAVNYLLEILNGTFEVQSFSYVDDAGNFHEQVELTQEGVATNFGCQFGCGIFILKKKPAGATATLAEVVS